MAAASQSFTIQVNSATAEKTSANEERFQINLSPAIDVPYMAQPRAQLDSIAFSNSFVNIAEHLDNNKIAFQLAYTQTIADANGHHELDAELSDKRYELTIPDGHYNVAALEEELARQAYLTHKASDKITQGHATYEPPSAITPSTSLWADMNILVTRKPFVNAPKPVGAGKDTDSETSSWRLASAVAKGDRTISLVAQYDSTTKQPLTYHLIAATLSSASTGTGGVANMFAAGTKITYIEPPNVAHNSQTIHISPGADVAVSGATALADTAVLVTPPAEYGYGVKAVAEPSLNPESGWGQVLSADEMRLISETKGSRANSIIPTEYVQKSTTNDNPTAIDQKDRYVKPFYLSPDESTGRMQIYRSVPAISVLDDAQARVYNMRSNLIDKALGYADSDMAKQEILINKPGGTGKPWTASNPGRMLRTRSLQFHCPTFINSSYDNTGKRQGGLLADIPITVPPGYVQAYAAAFDNSVPTALHGGAIDSVQFYLTNQDGETLHNQGQTFQATLRLFWNDPVPPQIGSAGAEAEDAYGLRDVMYAQS